MNETFRADVVGSLQRPGYLLEALKGRASGALSCAEFKKIEDRAVDEAIDLQESIGLDVVTDGEQRRKQYRDWLVEAVEGLSPIPAFPVPLRGLPGHADISRREPNTITGRLRLKRSVSVEEFAYARAKASKPIKVTVPHPMHCLLHYGEATADVYPDPFELFNDAAELVKQECSELAAIGCQHIQIDAPIVTWAFDKQLRQSFFPSRNIPPERFLEEAVRLVDLIAEVPGVRFALHLCRGNSPTHYFSAGSYDEAAKVVLSGTRNISTFLLEYDDWRAGSFEALKYIPDDKVIVLGLVASMKNAALESTEELKARIDEASKFVPLRRLALSSQCGFCSAVGLQGFPASVQEAKLRRIVEVARQVWG
jgi:5-methyltetrahydropteroyltriglutamate--homocysteine methyltransferase